MPPPASVLLRPSRGPFGARWGAQERSGEVSRQTPPVSGACWSPLHIFLGAVLLTFFA